MAKTIMVIDDDPVIVGYLKTLFEDNGYETLTAGDGSEGLELLKNRRPDLITLDLEMTNVWGPRFFRSLTKDPELSQIPVIVISGLSRPELAIKKAVATLSKPFDRDELLRLVRENIG